MECSICESEFAEGDAFCQGCGASLPTEPAEPGTPRIGGATITSASLASAPMVTAGTVPGTPLLLGDGELVWRQYRVSQLRKREQGEGILYVTDARVVFYAQAKGGATQRASALVQQTKLGDVTGLTAYVSHRISLAWFATALLLALLFLVSFRNQSWVQVVIFGLLLAGAVAMLVLGAAKRGSVGVQIQSNATQQSPIGFGQFGEQHGLIGTILHNLAAPFMTLIGVHTAFDVLVGFPGEDAEKVIAELGALIFDLQSRVNLAGTHWGVAAN